MVLEVERNWRGVNSGDECLKTGPTGAQLTHIEAIKTRIGEGKNPPALRVFELEIEDKGIL